MKNKRGKMYQNIYVQRRKGERICHIWDDEKGYYITPFHHYAYMKSPTGDYETIYGDRVQKVTSWTKFQWPNLFEADIPADTRMLVDLYADSDDPSTGHREVFFDIEVDTEEKYPDIEQADNKITAISIYERTVDEYFVYILDESDEVDEYNDGNVTVLPFNNEENLLEAFLYKWQELNPTIISGWNIDTFDVPYLYRRLARIFNVQTAKSLSPIGQVFWNKYRERFFIAGISSLDYMPIYRKFAFRPTNEALDMVARRELKRGKVAYEGNLNILFKTDIKKFIEYNLVDVELCVELDNKLNFIDLVRGICHKGHVPYEDIYFSSRWIEGAMLAFLKKKNIIAPNKKLEQAKDENADEKFKGAFVKSPKARQFYWIYDLDFTSLYPSIMTTLNISPETKVGKIKDWNPHDWVKRNIPQYEVEIAGDEHYMTSEEVETLLKEANLSVSAIGVLYRQEEQGLIPQILDEWFKDKEKFDMLSIEWESRGDSEKAKYYEDRRTIAKVMLNSIYGVLGLSKFRFYDLDNAESVTTTGQLLLKTTETIANHYYSSITGDKDDYCIYMDTDSLFLLAEPLIRAKFPDIDVKDKDFITEKILEIADETQVYLNNTFNEFAKRFLNTNEHRFDIKQEVIARSGIWTTKKRYALHIINKKGVAVDRIDYKGLDVKRQGFPDAFRDFMKDLVPKFLKDYPKEEIDEQVLDMKNKIYTFPVDKIASATAAKDLEKYLVPENKWEKPFGNWTKGAPGHTKAVIHYNEMLRYLNLNRKFPDIRSGEKIKWVYLRSNPYGIDRLAWKGYDDPKEILKMVEEYVDHKTIYEKVLKNKVQDFYTALNWTFPSKGTAIVNRFFS